MELFVTVVLKYKIILNIFMSFPSNSLWLFTVTT